MSDEAPLPTSGDVLKGIVFSEDSDEKGISTSENRYIRRFQKESVEGELNFAHLKGIRDHYKHKGRWSNFLISAIAAMLIFQSYLLIQVGSGIWDFSKYEWLLPALLVQNLAQVVGLSVWAVKYLFSDISNQKVD